MIEENDGKHKMIKGKITFLLPSKGRLQYLKETIDDIENNCSLPKEIFVIYCPEDKETVTWINGHDYRVLKGAHSVRFFPEIQEGPGFPNISKTCNYAMKSSTGEFVTWWSDDLLITPELFERMVEYMANERYPRNPIIAGVTVPQRNGDYVYMIDGFRNTYAVCGGKSRYEFKFGILRTDIYKKVGMLDVNLPGYRCDTEFNLRLIDAGFSIGMLPTVRVKHRAVNDTTRGLLKTTHLSGLQYMQKKWGKDYRTGRKQVIDQLPWFEKQAGAVFIYPKDPGEFGWEVMHWQAFVRRQAKFFDKNWIICPDSSRPLYQGINNVVFVKHKDDRNDEPLPGMTHYVWKKDQIIPHNQQEFIVYGVEKTEHPFDILIHARNTKHQEKNYPVELWERLVNLLLAEGYSVASIGNAAHHIEGTYDLTQESLSAVFDYMRTAKCIVGPSSGPMHLASLCNCPQVVWADERVYVGGDTLETRYTQSWNPLGVPVEYITTKWDSPDRWKPKTDDIINRVKTLIARDKKAPKPKTDEERFKLLKAAINTALEGGSFLIDVHYKTKDMRAEFKHFTIRKNFTDEDVKHCRVNLQGNVLVGGPWK